MLLVAGTKTTNHSSSGREGNFLAPSLMWTGGKMAMGMFTARIASTVVGAPHLCFFFFFSCLTLYLCGFLKVVGWEWPPAALRLGTPLIQWESLGLAWRPGLLPSKWGREGGCPLPRPTDEMGRGNFLQFSEASLSEGRGEDAWQRVTTALPSPWWVNRQVPTVRFAIRSGCWRKKVQHAKRSMIEPGNKGDLAFKRKPVSLLSPSSFLLSY